MLPADKGFDGRLYSNQTPTTPTTPTIAELSDGLLFSLAVPDEVVVLSFRTGPASEPGVAATLLLVGGGRTAWTGG